MNTNAPCYLLRPNKLKALEDIVTYNSLHDIAPLF